MRTVRSARLKIGMEVHIELATRSKMFTRVANIAHPDHYGASPNSLIDAVVAALPGALPVMNKAAIEMAMMVGLALHCQIARLSKWDRKNYFYPDLPKGYQISQYDLPLCFDGYLEIPGLAADGSPEVAGSPALRAGSRNDHAEMLSEERKENIPGSESRATKRIGIIRAHLEEDTGKLGHELPGGLTYEGSLVDLNRAGTPLLEIVTEPDLASADDAVIFGQELRNICRFLGVTEGVMQRGHMRFEPNINVIIDTPDGREYATPIVEVKNLNSFKALKAAIEYEFTRQIEQWKSDGLVQGPGAKNTRGWDDVRGVTVLQREKEDAHDYRYLPDPDLPPVLVSDAWRDEVAARIPELPAQRRHRYQQEFGLSLKDALALTDDADMCFFYEECIKALHQLDASRVPMTHPARECAKWLLNAGAKRANERRVGVHELGIAPRQIAQIIELREKDMIGSSAADELFGVLCEPEFHAIDALNAARQRGLLQVQDEHQIDVWVSEAIAAQPQAASDYQAGKETALGRLVGQVMRASHGQADAKTVTAKLRHRLRNL